MKKLFLILCSIALLSSCSDDDDVNGDDQILGTWFVVKINNSHVHGLELSECNQESNITFNSDFSTYSEYHTEIDGKCQIEDTTESTWSKDNEIYTFTVPFEGIGELNGTANFQGNTFIFSPVLSPDTTIIFEMR